MSGTFHQVDNFNFSSGYERSITRNTSAYQDNDHDHQHQRSTPLLATIQVQLSCDEPPPPPPPPPIYDGMLSEMFAATSGVDTTLENHHQIPLDYYHHRWPRHHHQHQQQQQPTLAAQDFFENKLDHMVMGGIGFLDDHHQIQKQEIGVGGSSMESQGLALSLSSSMQHLEVTKVEGLRIGGNNGGMYFHGGTGSDDHQGLVGVPSSSFDRRRHQVVHVGFGTATATATSSTLGMMSGLKNSRYAKAGQELLEEFCSVTSDQYYYKNFRLRRKHNTNPSNSKHSSGDVGSSSSFKKELPYLSAADKTDYQRKKIKLLSLLDEVDGRYSNYCEQMQVVVNSFNSVLGFGAATPYTALAHKAMSRHFRTLKDAITAQLKITCEILGEKDFISGALSSGLTKGETPSLKKLDQSYRQQKAMNQIGLVDVEAWRPQRGLPDRSVNILRAWLFEHFLNPYPSDADKHLLSRQTGLSRNQVSNWFINARVRLWKPMVEEMYRREAKEEGGEEGGGGGEEEEEHQKNIDITAAEYYSSSPSKRTETNAGVENDVSHDTTTINYSINNRFSSSSSKTTTPHIFQSPTTTSITRSHESDMHYYYRTAGVAADCDHDGGGSGGYGNDGGGADMGSSSGRVVRLLRTPAGDVSLTLGRDFGSY